MSPKKRNRKNSDLTGTNIKPVKRKSGKPDEHYDYYYNMPNGTVEFLSKNRKDAIEAAIDLNRVLRPSGSIVERITEKDTQPKYKNTPMDDVSKIADDFITEFLPEKNYSETTLTQKIRIAGLISEHWKDVSISRLSTRHIVEYLRTLTVAAYIKHRVVLNDLFLYAIHAGYIEANPVAVTMKKTDPKRKRKKHTVEGWNKIRDAAPEWLQRAMDIALLTLQRRSDLTGIHHDHVDLDKRTIKILQDKTRNYNKPVYIEIKMGQDLFDAIRSCYRTGIICPWLIHYRPIKMPPAHIRAKKRHPFAVENSYLSHSFSRVRDECGAYDHIEKGMRPSLHDARGLGAWMYEQAGFDKSYIQLLTGHASEKMLQIYIDGHEEQKPVQVSADLKIRKDIY